MTERKLTDNVVVLGTPPVLDLLTHAAEQYEDEGLTEFLPDSTPRDRRVAGDRLVRLGLLKSDGESFTRVGECAWDLLYNLVAAGAELRVGHAVSADEDPA